MSSLNKKVLEALEKQRVVAEIRLEVEFHMGGLQ